MKTITGKIQSFNVSPKGFYESILLQNGKGIVQVNFPHNAGSEVAHNFAPGQDVTVPVKEIEDHRPSQHPVYEWIQDLQAVQEGTVKRINYARHGEPNGAILETGEFIHLRPEGAKSIQVQVGQKLSFEGEVRSSPHGQIVIEARVVNGHALKQHKPKPKKKG